MLPQHAQVAKRESLLAVSGQASSDRTRGPLFAGASFRRAALWCAASARQVLPIQTVPQQPSALLVSWAVSRRLPRLPAATAWRDTRIQTAMQPLPVLPVTLEGTPLLDHLFVSTAVSQPLSHGAHTVALQVPTVRQVALAQQPTLASYALSGNTARTVLLIVPPVTLAKQTTTRTPPHRARSAMPGRSQTNRPVPASSVHQDGRTMTSSRALRACLALPARLLLAVRQEHVHNARVGRMPRRRLPTARRVPPGRSTMMETRQLRVWTALLEPMLLLAASVPVPVGCVPLAPQARRTRTLAQRPSVSRASRVHSQPKPQPAALFAWLGRRTRIPTQQRPAQSAHQARSPLRSLLHALRVLQASTMRTGSPVPSASAASWESGPRPVWPVPARIVRQAHMPETRRLHVMAASRAPLTRMKTPRQPARTV